MLSPTVRSGTSTISCARVGKTYDTASGERVDALVNIDIDIREGEFFSIVGPSGCGKSTLLKILAGLIPVSGGQASVRGKPAGSSAQDIGVVFQSPTLLEWRTVLANTTLAADVHGLDKAEMARRGRELLAMVGLDKFADKYPGELSGGMQQRVAITRALLHKPPVLLMDEPFGALDALTREQMTHELQRIWMDQKVTVLFITHSITEAVFLSDRVAVMSARPGRVLEILDIDLPRPRELDMMTDPGFGAYSTRIRQLLEARAIKD